jgi:PadR family transcriptional regulator, regulatory protein AphA
MNNTRDHEVSLLGFLTRKPMHGYDIFKEISGLSGVGIVWRVKTGRLYAMLHKLEEFGYVSSSIAQEGNRPQKTQYSITKEGSDVYRKWLTKPVQKGRDFRITFLLKFYFALDKSSSLAKKLIKRQREECETWLEKYSKDPLTDKDDFSGIVWSFRKTQIQGYINWLDLSKKHIEEEEK